MNAEISLFKTTRALRQAWESTHFMSWGLAAVLAVVALSAALIFGLKRGTNTPAGASQNTALNASAPIDHSKYPSIVLGMGCFWGAEKRMQELAGVLDVEAGYAGGDNPNPSYDNPNDAIPRDGYKGKSHAEVVRVYYDPQKTSLEQVLAQFWQSHNPTQGNRQGNDVGENYRSAIYFQTGEERDLAMKTQAIYQQNLKDGGNDKTITTEIEPLRNYKNAEDYHQDYLLKNPQGYCGLGGTGIAYHDSNMTLISAPNSAASSSDADPMLMSWDNVKLNEQEQLIAFEAAECAYCKRFNAEIGDKWQNPTSLVKTHLTKLPDGWTFKEELFATPTIVYFKNKTEVARFTGYTDAQKFWKWWGFQSLTDKQKKIAYSKGTEMPFTGGLLDEKRSGTYVDPVTGVPLFRSDTKFNSGTGWPSFFDPLPNAVILKPEADGRTEVISASSGVHLGHVFDDGPPPTNKRFCINSEILKFVPNAGQ